MVMESLLDRKVLRTAISVRRISCYDEKCSLDNIVERITDNALRVFYLD
jgi:hypothetical protein